MTRTSRKQRRTGSDFAIAIDFVPGSPDPGHIFRSMVRLIEAFQRFDRELVRTIDVNIEPVLVLEDIQTGSLKAWVRSVLSSIDDTALGSGDWKRIVGNFLMRAKYLLLRHLDRVPDLGGREQITMLQNEIQHVAEETGVRRIPAYSLPDPGALVDVASEIGAGVGILQPQDRAFFQLKDGTQIRVNPNIHIDPELLFETLVDRTLSNDEELILKVKKPDFLGDSRWEFVHDTVVEARMLDMEWVNRFRNNEVVLEPGSAIRAL